MVNKPYSLDNFFSYLFLNYRSDIWIISVSIKLYNLKKKEFVGKRKARDVFISSKNRVSIIIIILIDFFISKSYIFK
jgi:hypothetical protein